MCESFGKLVWLGVEDGLGNFVEVLVDFLEEFCLVNECVDFEF